MMLKMSVCMLAIALSAGGYAKELRELSRTVIRESEYPMNFCFAKLYSDGHIHLDHTFGTHREDERAGGMYSADSGRTWAKGMPPIPGINSFETKDGRKRSLEVWNRICTNEHVMTLMTLERDGTVSREKVRVSLPFDCWCLAHRETVRLRNGRLLQTMYGHPKGGNRNIAYLMTSSDDGMSWQFLSKLPFEPDAVEGASEPNVVELRDGALLAFVRTCCPWYGDGRHTLMQYASRDGGKTWGERKVISETGVAPQAQVLSDGTLAVLSGRPGVFLLLDPSGKGENYSRHDIYTGMGSSYSTLMETAPGKLLLVYDESSFTGKPGPSPTNRIVAVTYRYKTLTDTNKRRLAR